MKRKTTLFNIYTFEYAHFITISIKIHFNYSRWLKMSFEVIKDLVSVLSFQSKSKLWSKNEWILFSNLSWFFPSSYLLQDEKLGWVALKDKKVFAELISK